MTGRRSADSLGAGIFLIGIGTLFLLRGRVGFFPAILVVIGLAGLPSALSGSRGWAAWQGLFWLAGLAVLFATGSIWPGILVLIGVSMLLGALGHNRAQARPEPDIAHEPVTTVPLARAAAPPAQPAPVTPTEPFAAVEVDEHGTAPLSSTDIDVLEAELAAQVEGSVTPRPVAVANTTDKVTDDSTSDGVADLVSDEERQRDA